MCLSMMYIHINIFNISKHRYDLVFKCKDGDLWFLFVSCNLNLKVYLSIFAKIKKIWKLKPW